MGSGVEDHVKSKPDLGLSQEQATGWEEWGEDGGAARRGDGSGVAQPSRACASCQDGWHPASSSIEVHPQMNAE